jgi:DNA-binding response OmpR family regulator
VSQTSVLVIDDDADIRGLLRGLLERAGHRVVEAADGRAGLRALHEQLPDLVLLDVAMPELDGWTTLERIRDLTNIPVLMLTAHDAEIERVRGLKAGADDYVVKPFGRQELVARVDALLRRRQSAGTDPTTYADARVSIAFDQHVVRYDEREIALTPLEFQLLAAFVRHPNQLLSHAQLLGLVWGGTVGTSADQVKLYVGYLRRKLSPEAPATTPIETVRGFGYRYRPPR